MTVTLLISCGASSDSAAHYIEAVRRAGWRGSIELVSPGGRRHADDERPCGLLLTGGGDVHPRNWRTPEPMHPRTRADDERDALELPLVRWAWNRQLPILGICRGAQIVNVARGGDLLQDIADAAGCAAEVHAHGASDRVDLRHAVRVLHGSRLERLVGTASLHVNSRHHQAVRHLGSGLVASAFHDSTRARGNPLVEAIEAADPRRWVFGVQWHPENLVAERGRHGAAARALFSAFVIELQRARPRSQASFGEHDGDDRRSRDERPDERWHPRLRAVAARLHPAVV